MYAKQDARVGRKPAPRTRTVRDLRPGTSHHHMGRYRTGDLLAVLRSQTRRPAQLGQQLSGSNAAAPIAP